MAASLQGFTESKNGFNLDNSSIDTDKILSGGPQKDGIPSIDHPKFIPVTQSELKDDDYVVGIVYRGIAKAYPIGILNWHEVVNDTFDQEGIVVSYCPLCGTAVAFKSSITGDTLEFGVSGLLYESDVLLYDRQTLSLWSQILGSAVTGAYKNTAFESIPINHTSFGQWKKSHPDSLILSTDTGFKRNYFKDPYSGYEVSDQIYFPVTNSDSKQFHPKQKVLGIKINQTFKAYSLDDFKNAEMTQLFDTIDGVKVLIKYDIKANSATAFNAKNEQIVALTSYWFAWYSFHPDTLVHDFDE
ncbi:MAG: DUF3179 domain-containing protein [Saccharospirillaceae bacterium]|nr:DUF3179 domain-containing protein [Saccharospirillaceae bacterium]